jgi:uncharacterized membrane protein
MNRFQEWITAFFSGCKGRTIGILSGLLLGILILTLGFWKSVLLALCIGLGYWLGSFHDRKENFLAFLDKILPNGIRNKMQ